MLLDLRSGRNTVRLGCELSKRCARRGFVWTLHVLVGINLVKRKLAAHDNLKITVQQTGDKFHVTESSNFRTIDIDFTLGVSFSYSLADGTELTVRTETFIQHSTTRNLFYYENLWDDFCTFEQRDVFLSWKSFCFSLTAPHPGFVDDWGRHIEGSFQQKGQRKAAHNNQGGPGRRAHSGEALPGCSAGQEALLQMTWRVFLQRLCYFLLFAGPLNNLSVE